ncbi:T9SS type A sorting domain-containing protein [uncultured Flavobacterium sp.]|nr:hypothetical protein [Flavobacterium sp.]
MYDGIGKKVFETKANVQEFDISGLNAGIYFCKITNSDNSIKFQKIIKK